MRAYITVVLTIMVGVMFWFAFNFLTTGFGLPYGMGVCTGIGLTLALMWYGGLWAESARRREERRHALTPTRRAE